MSDGSKQQHLYESLSALVDNEASELELHRILSESERDPSVRARWHRYQLARTALNGEVAAAGVDISDAVRDAVAKLDMSSDNFSDGVNISENKTDSSQELNSNQNYSADLLQNSSVDNAAVLANPSSTSGWRANLARFAIAASVAGIVVVSSQQFNLLGASSDTPFVASNPNVLSSSAVVPEEPVEAVPQNSPFAVVDLQNVAGTFNSLSTPQQSRLPQQAMSYSPTQQQKQLQDERVRLYIQQLMLEHAENTAQHSGAGLLPYTKVPVEVQR